MQRLRTELWATAQLPPGRRPTLVSHLSVPTFSQGRNGKKKETNARGKTNRAVVFALTIPAQLLQAPPPKYSDATTCDPLRELVLCSKNYDCEPERLNDLATQAANLHRAEEAAAPGMPKPGFQMLAGIFADTEETIKSIGSRMKKASYSALDTSDCDEFLGKDALFYSASRGGVSRCFRSSDVGEDVQGPQGGVGEQTKRFRKVSGFG